MRSSIGNAVTLAWQEGARVVAAPLIGAGTGGLDGHQVLELMADELRPWAAPLKAADSMTVRVVVFEGS